MATSYKDAGVDVAAGDALVDWLQADTSEVPHKDKIVSGIGGFAALFRANFSHLKKPILVSCTDGVGTKVKLAAEFNRYASVGQDLVAMCVNDMACVGAEPLFFLDYYASGKLDLSAAKDFLKGVRSACHRSGCALIGGETAEMPGVYQKNDFDCAGFSVGVVDEDKAFGPDKVKVGDQLLAIESSGFHSNGYSLLRKVFASDLKQWSEKLLIPTHLYPGAVAELLRNKIEIHAAAHVTGGGLDNLLRVIPKGTGLHLNPWPVPDIFLEVKDRAQLDWPNLLTTLNCGLGFVLYLPAEFVSGAENILKKLGFNSYLVGEVVKSEKSQWNLDFSKMKGK